MDNGTGNKTEKRSYLGILHFEEEKFIVDDSGLRFRFGEMSAAVLGDDFHQAVQLAHNVVQALSAYRDIIKERLEGNEQLLYTDLAVSFGADTLELQSSIAELSRLSAGHEIRELYDEMFGILPVAMLCAKPLYEIYGSRVFSDRCARHPDNLVGTGPLEALDEKIQAVNRKLEPLDHVELDYKPILLQTIRRSPENPAETNADRAVGFVNEDRGNKPVRFIWGDLPRNWSLFSRYSHLLDTSFSVTTINGKSRFIAKYTPGNLIELLFLDYMKILEQNVVIKVCENCRRYFVPEIRVDEVYCSRPVRKTGKTCKDVGANISYRKKLTQSPYLEERQKFYQSMHASLLRPYRNATKEIKDKKRELLTHLVGEVNGMIGLIEKATGEEREALTNAMMQWMENKKSQYMARKRVK